MIWLPFIILLGVVLSKEFPEPLNAKQFNKLLEDGKLHLVEFYSPFCSYCSHLAPTWKKTWERGQDLDILNNFNFTLERVNCVESGDLCYDEKIDYFPSFRLYGPSGFIKYYPDDRKKTVEEFIKFVRSASLDLTNYEEKGPNDKSLGLTGEAFKEIMNNEALETPYLVSFWPSKLLSSTDDDIEFENCLECFPFQRTWNILTKNLVNQNIKTAHINCKNSVSLCNNLGFDDLGTIKNHRADRLTRVALVIPSNMNHGKGNRLVVYDKKYFTDYREIEDFTIRSLQNSLVDEFPSEKLTNLYEIDPNEYLKPFPENIDSYLVYVNEVDDAKDEEYLDALIDIASNTEGTSLYRANAKTFLPALKSTLAKVAAKLTDNEDIDKAINILSLKNGPSLYFIQRGDIRPRIYPVDKAMDVKKFSEKVEKWVTTSNIVSVTEASSWKFNKLLNYDTSFNRYILIQIVDTFTASNRKQTTSLLTKLNNFLQTYTLQALELYGRKNKLLESLGSDENSISHKRDNSQIGIIGTFLELQEAKSFLRKNGLFKSNSNYNIGDLIIIDRKSGLFFDAFKNGDKLNIQNSSPLSNALLLQTFENDMLLEGRLMSSPYPDFLRFMDRVHQHGFIGYISIVIIITFLFYVASLFGQRNLEKGKNGSYSPLKENKEY
ncbi:ER-retained PMA1-suppressing protein 1 [Nakaseomyces bracarensis]|uniref:ER-retained PMA1-suppressing protein 1 n=1 Tax=Nakaseomyces bracarensis TaxID=273131 RepID=A0ABR4NME5_9SACH